MSLERLIGRMKEIEERKIEILIETGQENARYSEVISRLNSEYERLSEEYLELKLMTFKIKNGKCGKLIPLSD